MNRPSDAFPPSPPMDDLRSSRAAATSLDVAFTVPTTHRLRFTQDVFGADAEVLEALLEPSGEQPPRVQFWLDEQLAQARPELPALCERFVASRPGRFRPAGNVQFVPGGEAIKNDVHILERMLKVVHHHELDRRSYMVVIGGGAVLDAVGFAAAIAHRGIRLVRLPTTTLSQADSGVGVKNGVNLFGKKNWLGSFAVPWGVVNDAALLSTLSDRDFRCGFSEAVKVTLLKDPAAFDELCRLAPAIRERVPAASERMIFASAKLHLDHITRRGDPFEMLEARPLDYGHWSAHKLEALTEFSVRHGEAVALGVAWDTIYSSLRYGFPWADAVRTLECLRNLGFELWHPQFDSPGPIFAGLEEFRQHLGGRLTLTMLEQVGRAIDVHEVDAPLLERALVLLKDFSLAGSTAPPAGCRAV